MSASLRPFAVTLFPDFAASSKQLQTFTLESLQAKILQTSAPSKDRLPWLKLAQFGEIRTKNQSLRSNRNVLSISGIEADYDGGVMLFEEAVKLVHEAGLEALVYTSPSHTPEAPRWRVLCPFSTELPPEQRTRMLARLNGLFDGAFAGESWTLSQSYYYGAVNQNPAHRAIVVEGRPIDQLDLLDGISIGKPGSRSPAPEGGSLPHRAERSVSSGWQGNDLLRKRVDAFVAVSLRKIRAAAEADVDKHTTTYKQAIVIGGYLAHANYSNAVAVEWIMEALGEAPRDKVKARRTAMDGLAVGRTEPFQLEDRSNPTTISRGISTQPEPPPHPGPKDPARSAKPVSSPDGKQKLVWPEPLDILAANDLGAAPVLEARHVPDVIYAFCTDVAGRLGVDKTTVALPALTACASMMTEDWKVQPKRHDHTWTEGARLWCAIVGDPGILKSPVISVCTRPIDKIDAQARELHKQQMREYRAAVAQAKLDKEPEPQQPRLSRYLIESTTIEALSEVLRDDDEARQHAPLGKVLSRQDEMTEFLGGLDRYKAGAKGGGDRGAYLRLYNGGRHTIDRIGRGTFAIPSWSANFIGGIQPGPIARLARDTSDDGLLQRFLYVVPDSGHTGEDRAPDKLILHRYEALFPALLALQPGQPIGGGDPRALVLDEGAQQHREILDMQIRALANMPDTTPRTRSALDKWSGVFARLCLTFHLIDIADARALGVQAPIIDVIKEPVAAKVAGFMLQILLPHLLRANAIMLSSEQTGHAAWIAGYILTHRLETISVRDIVRSYKALQAPEMRRELNSVMDSLSHVGWCEPEQPGNPVKGVTSWMVNPAVHARFAEQAARERERREARKVEMGKAFAARATQKAETPT